MFRVDVIKDKIVFGHALAKTSLKLYGGPVRTIVF